MLQLYHHVAVHNTNIYQREVHEHVVLPGCYHGSLVHLILLLLTLIQLERKSTCSTGRAAGDKRETSPNWTPGWQQL